MKIKKINFTLMKNNICHFVLPSLSFKDYIIQM